MAWTTQFYHEFYDTNDLLCRVDILKDAAALDIELEGEPSPFKIILPDIKDKLEPVRGSGCELNLFSATDRQLLSLFTADIQEYRIKYAVATVTTWFGYLDSEQYSEDYSQLTDYPLQFTGNNGLGVLDRIKFLDGTANYTGLKTQWEVLEIILTKWGLLLDYVTAIKVFLATTSALVNPGVGKNILHMTYMKSENCYDEDNEPMSCREVLEAILAPYGAFLTVIGTEILIIDLHTLATDSGFTWQVFDNTLTYDTTEASDAIGDIETIGYFETGAKLDMIAGRNTQIVKYSPYAVSGIEQSIQNVEDMTFSSGTEPAWTNIGDGVMRAENISGLAGWTFNGPINLDRLVGLKESTSEEPEFFIRIKNPNYNVETVDHSATVYDAIHSSYEWDIPYVIGRGAFSLKITGEIRATDIENVYGTPTSGHIHHVGLAVRVWIGTQSFEKGGYTWTSGNTYLFFAGGDLGDNNYNEWQKLSTLWDGVGSDTGIYPVTEDGIFIGFNTGQQGKIKLEFTYYVQGAGDGVFDDEKTKDIISCDIKNFKIELVERPSMEKAGESDFEYEGVIITGWKDKGITTELKHGTSFPGTPWDRGGLVFDYAPPGGTYRYFSHWSRGSAATMEIEKLLLNTIQSNYETKTTELSVKINNSSHKPFLRIEDDTYLSGKILMFAGGTLDCVNNSLECSLVEIKPDNLTIA